MSGTRDIPLEAADRLRAIVRRLEAQYETQTALSKELRKRGVRWGQPSISRFMHPGQRTSIMVAKGVCDLAGEKLAAIGLGGFDDDTAAVKPALAEPLESFLGWFYKQPAVVEAFKEKAGDYTVADLLAIRSTPRPDRIALSEMTADQVHVLVKELRLEGPSAGHDIEDDDAAAQVVATLQPSSKRKRSPRGKR